MNFCSDNVAGACPEIIDHLHKVNEGPAMPYGADEVTARVQTKLSDIFEREVTVYPVATGTAANALALSTFTPPYGSVLCHKDSHINVDECGAPEFFGNGSKLIPFEGEGSKLSPADLNAYLAQGWKGDVHHAQPSAISITQSTETGTLYGLEEIASLSDVAKANGTALHMDGARFANALVGLGCSPAEMTWKSGVDVLSFGATKNGALGAEAVIFFDPNKAGDFIFRRKRAGHLFSKMRFLSAQIEAYLAGDLWLKNARNANDTAQILWEGLAKVPGIRFLHPVEANELFVFIPEAAARRLREQGFAFYDWPFAGKDCRRLVTAWNTRKEDVDRFVATVAKEITSAA